MRKVLTTPTEAITNRANIRTILKQKKINSSTWMLKTEDLWWTAVSSKVLRCKTQLLLKDKIL